MSAASSAIMIGGAFGLRLHERRHDRRVDDAQAVDAMDSQRGESHHQSAALSHARGVESGAQQVGRAALLPGVLVPMKTS
jgi:hypothetical protein